MDIASTIFQDPKTHKGEAWAYITTAPAAPLSLSHPAAAQEMGGAFGSVQPVQQGAPTPETHGCLLWHRWQHRPHAHRGNALGLLPDPKMKLRGVCWSCSVCKHGCLLLVLSQTLLLLEIECATARESLTSVQRLKAGSRKLTVTYGLLKFFLPLLCNSFSLLSALLNIFEFIWFWHFLPLFL